MGRKSRVAAGKRFAEEALQFALVEQRLNLTNPEADKSTAGLRAVPWTPCSVFPSSLVAGSGHQFQGRHIVTDVFGRPQKCKKNLDGECSAWSGADVLAAVT